PVDCIVLDAEYELGYEPFRIDSSRFPDMRQLADKLAAMNIEVTASVYPGVHIDSMYDSYNEGLKKDVFIKYAGGNLFQTEIAPLKVVLPDYTNPKARWWWKEKMKWFAQNHIHGYWNDMNEPAVGGSYLPGNLLFDFDGKTAPAAEAKNIYGFQMARSSFEAALQNEKDRRPFVLTRSGFAGVQRYAAMWSGDNTASDEGLLTGILINNNMGLSGVPFIGYDIGGFIGNGSKELFTRFIEAGIFSPFCRNHKEMYAADNEPYAYGKETEAVARKFIELRYRLLPYIYPAFYQSSQNGMPVARSLCIDYPFDKRIYNDRYQYEFLFGKDILVVPVTGTATKQPYYLPQGNWYDLYSDKLIAGSSEFADTIPLQKLPLFIKASAIIPFQSVIQSTKDKPSDTLQLHVYKGAEENAFIYYEDSGDGFEYRNGLYCRRAITYYPSAKTIVIGKQEGSFTSRFTELQVIFHGFGEEMKNIRLNNARTLQIDSRKEVLLKGGDDDPVPIMKSVVTGFDKNEIKISW
ncbi:MAG TPA: TIM-barrel domain-containing protein, partial [Chitinophagaceae bacterium]|nr:TIM-barrel domain-containing protein [Chitinophagaceae bacterium]